MSKRVGTFDIGGACNAAMSEAGQIATERN
jgi:hypothetical protein